MVFLVVAAEVRVVIFRKKNLVSPNRVRSLDLPREAWGIMPHAPRGAPLDQNSGPIYVFSW